MSFIGKYVNDDALAEYLIESASKFLAFLRAVCAAPTANCMACKTLDLPELLAPIRILNRLKFIVSFSMALNFFMIDCQVKCNKIKEKIYELPRQVRNNPSAFWVYC